MRIIKVKSCNKCPYSNYFEPDTSMEYGTQKVYLRCENPLFKYSSQFKCEDPNRIDSRCPLKKLKKKRKDDKMKSLSSLKEIITDLKG